MGGEARVRFLDQLLIEPGLAHTGLVTGDKDDGAALGIEGVGETPDAVRGPEAEFLHVGETRAVQCVCVRTTELGTEFGEHRSVCVEGVPDSLGKTHEFGIELFMEENGPNHVLSMAPGTYVVKYIFRPRKIFGRKWGLCSFEQVRSRTWHLSG